MSRKHKALASRKHKAAAGDGVGVASRLMPAKAPASPHRVCIVILTYKRNDALLRLVTQCREIIGQYRGHNAYELCVADSDRNNPIAADLQVQDWQVRYSTNPGSGFDDNIYHFWLNHVEKYDFIFSMSDDDLFAPWLNPLYLLDAAIESGKQVMLFNHRYYTSQPNGGIELGGVNYPETELVYDQAALLQRVFRTLPSHIGILYSTKLLRIVLAKAAEFRGTLHLYAVPVLFAAAGNTLLFSEHVLCLYANDLKTDGAWSEPERVMTGLVEFLQKLKKVVPPHLYSVAENGFFDFYFGPDCWLRQRLRDDPGLKSEPQIRQMLAGS